MKTKLPVKTTKTAAEIADDFNIADNVQFMLASEGRYFDYKADPEIMAAIRGDVTMEQVMASSESRLKRATKRTQGRRAV